MGIGNALRRVWGAAASPATPPRDFPAPRSRRSRSSRINPRVRADPSPPIPPPTPTPPPPPPPSPPPPQPPLPSQQKVQEQLVITSYRTRLTRISARLAARWQTFDAQPDEYAPTLDIREIRASLQMALESYYAAVGGQTVAGIEDVLELLRTTDTRLALLDAEVAAEVGRFQAAVSDVAARYDGVQSPSDVLNVYADADVTLMELELYRDAWVAVMNTATCQRLEEAHSVLRGIVQRAAPSPPAALHMPAAHMNAPKEVPHPFPSQLHPSIDNGTGLCRAENAPSPSFGTYESVLRGGYDDPGRSNSNKTYQVHHEVSSYNRRGQSPASANRNALANSLPRVEPSPESKQKETSSHIASGLGLDDRPDAVSSESGDDGPMLMMMSRTRTLRDMAESVMGLKDDDQPGTAFDSQKLNGRVEVPDEDYIERSKATPTSLSRTSRASRPDRVGSNRLHSSSRDPVQPNLALSKTASFASTLYSTRHERVDSISDVGILLQRSIVRGDGRCLFRAVVRGRAILRRNPILGERFEREEADLLRSRAVEELIKYRELLARFFVIEGDFAQYTKKMSHPRTYGGEPELLMLAKLLHVPIAVYILKNGCYRQIQVYGKPYRGQPLRVLYSDGVHYDALLVVSRN